MALSRTLADGVNAGDTSGAIGESECGCSGSWPGARWRSSPSWASVPPRQGCLPRTLQAGWWTPASGGPTSSPSATTGRCRTGPRQPGRKQAPVGPGAGRRPPSRPVAGPPGRRRRHRPRTRTAGPRPPRTAATMGGLMRPPTASTRAGGRPPRHRPRALVMAAAAPGPPLAVEAAAAAAAVQAAAAAQVAVPARAAALPGKLARAAAVRGAAVAAAADVAYVAPAITLLHHQAV